MEVPASIAPPLATRFLAEVTAASDGITPALTSLRKGELVMGFSRQVPPNANEVKKYLEALQRHRELVRGVLVHPMTCHIEVNLDSAMRGDEVPDLFFPIRRSMLHEATKLVERILLEMDEGFPPTEIEANHLFDLIDPMGK